MDPANLLNPVVLVYLLIVVAGQVGLGLWFRRDRLRTEARRRAVGLPRDVLLNTAVQLRTVRRRSVAQAGMLLITVVVSPFVLWQVAGDVAGARDGLALVFAALLVWLLFTATDMGKAFLGGLAFRTLLAFTRPFQVGDRVTLRGHGGKVVDIGLFHVSVVTPDDDLISIPTAGLWGEALVSANAGERASLCVMPFYLAPFVSRNQRRLAEDALWDAVLASTFFDFTEPMQIYIEQREASIVLTAKAYVSSTYDEPLFKSDVARTFLDWAADNQIPLASPRWREKREQRDSSAVPEEREVI